MLLDDVLPEYDFRERHEALVSAPAGAVRAAVEAWRPDSSLPWRVLLRLRGLGRPAGTLREWAESNGFLRLAQSEDEVVYAQAGRFWALDERGALVSPRTPEEFRAAADPGAALAAMNVLVEELGPVQTRLSTETRVRALGGPARRRFRAYWLLIRPFSGFLRRSMLRGVARLAQTAIS